MVKIHFFPEPLQPGRRFHCGLGHASSFSLFSSTLLSYFPWFPSRKKIDRSRRALDSFSCAVGGGYSAPAYPPIPALFSPASGDPVPLWLFSLFLFLLLGTRFYKLTTLPFWPIGDEGMLANLAMGLSKHWDWSPLVAEVRVEALAAWLLAVFMRVVPPFPSGHPPSFPPLFPWRRPELPIGRAGNIFPGVGLFVFCWLMALSFWELTLARFCVHTILTALFQCLCFGWLGIFMKSGEGRARWKALFMLSFCAGLGFYTFTNWAVVWLSIGLLLFAWLLDQKAPSWNSGFFFLGISLLLALPWMEARLAPGGMNHIHGSFGGLSSWGGYPRLYLRGIFWDGSASFPFGPVWGGFLNPVFGRLWRFLDFFRPSVV